MKGKCLFSALVLGLGLTLALLWLLGSPSARPLVARAASHTVCVAGPPDCDYSTIQDAVDAAGDGDVIKVASGTYTGVQGRPVPAGYPSPPASGTVTQVVYVSRTVTIRGGYTTTNGFADPPDPEANRTVLDALGQGRVLLVAGAGISPTIEGLRVTGGNAYWLGGGEEDSLYRGAGGGVYVINATATLSNCRLFDNTACYGGGLWLQDSDATLSNNTVSSNTAHNGGGLCLEDSDAILISNTIASNAAYYWGGGLNLENSAATLSDNTITANTAGRGGGGLYLRGVEATLSDNAVLSNTAGGTGGGLHLGDSDVTLSSNTICSNTVNWDGGGLYLSDSAATLNDNNIFSNTARYGGGLRLYNNSPATTLNSNTVSSNTAYYGGGLNLWRSVATLNDNTISSNIAYTSGGGLYLEDSAATLSGNWILSNTAIYSGGGLYLQYSNVTLINAVVADNQANSRGSGLYISGSSPHLLHTTIARNNGGDGSGVYVVTGPRGGHSAVALTNTILVSHAAGITVAAGNEARLETTLWGTDTWANLTDWGGEGTIIAEGNLWGDPVFGDPDAGDYHIGSASAARDVVSFIVADAGLKRDIDGQLRPMDWGYDLGADEFPGAGLGVVKRPSAVSGNPGQVLTYTILVTSAGAGNATGIVLSDTLDGWQRPIGTASSAGGCSVTDGGWGGAVVCPLGALVSGATARVTLTAQVSTTVTPRQAMTNTVVVTANETTNGVQITTYGQDCHARINDAPREYTHVQVAVDAASPGDLVKVAGICVGAGERGGLRQQIYLTKRLTIRGGYTTTNGFAGPPDPEANPTTLDALGLGRVLYITGDVNPTVEGLRITGGDAEGLGGGEKRWDAGGGVYVVDTTATIRDNQVFSNTAMHGGGLYFRNSDGTQLADNSISGNSTFLNGRGGGLYFENSADVTLTGNTISHNEPAPWRRGWGGGGGAVFDHSPGATLSDNVISENRATWAGGLHFLHSPGATLIANTINDNVADHSGGGMKNHAGALFEHSDNATLISNTISGNRTANICGGVCFETSHNAVLSGNVIISNTRGRWWDGHGVGVYLNDSENTSLFGNIISRNTAYDLDAPGTILGGGLYIGNSTAELISNTISSNGATRGGGLYVASNSSVTLTSNTIASNAVYDACGTWCDGPKGTGGGLHLSDSTAALSNTLIADNQVETAGAGLYVERSAITLTNPIVVDNQVTLTGRFTGAGSGLYIAGSSARLLHPTIARNSGGDGSGLHITGTVGTTSTVAMTNTILVSHTVGITVGAGNTATLTATLWGTGAWANLADWGGAGTSITGPINLWGDPDFIDPDAGDYHIGPDSAARDAGIDAGVTTDIDADPRPIDTEYDIGADEFPAALAVSKHAELTPVLTGAQLTYTIRVTNTGNVDLRVTITDLLPSHVTPSGSLTWASTITAPGGVWRERAVVAVTEGYSGTLTNVVRVTTIEGATGVYTETYEVQLPKPVYLPLVLRQFP
jgi:uncharacterized repeat protein (TIGR01451 family)